MAMKRRNIDRRRKRRTLRTEVRSLRLTRSSKLADVVEDFAGMSVQARQVGNAARIYRQMLEDDDEPVVFLGLAGPLVAAGLREVIADLIRRNYVDVVVSTGAVLYQDLYQALGGRHYKGHPDMDDVELEKLDIDRIYDTLVDDELFVEYDNRIRDFAGTLEPGIYSSRRFLRELTVLAGDDKGSILKACRDRDVPIFSPALNDSSIGIGLTGHYALTPDPHERVILDSIMDNVEITHVICGAQATSGIYIGGGTPKNFINDAIVMAAVDFGAKMSGHRYAIQLTTAHETDGGLSGSTLSEAKSWGKIEHKAAVAMAHVEASVSLPLVAGYVLGKCGKRKGKRLERSLRDRVALKPRN